MLKFRKSIASLLLLVVVYPTSVFGNLNEKMRKTFLDDLEHIRTVFSVQYAPRGWKGEYKNWDLESEIKQAKSEIANMSPLTIKGYQRVVRKFFQSCSDYHVGVEFFSTEMALLPFGIRGTAGRYFIVEIDRDLLPQHVFSAEIGDEVLFFDNKPIAEAVSELKKSDFNNNTPGTDQALAELALTSRPGHEGLIVPQGKVNVVVRTRKGEIRNLVTNWLYFPELINEPGSRINSRFFAKGCEVSKKESIHNFLEKKMVYAQFSNSRQLPDTDQASFQIGAKKSYIPSLGSPIWQSPVDDTFYAYIFLQSGKRIGYLRIPHYMGDEEEVEEFRKLIKRMESKTDALVIDQVNNPGGSVFYLYALASMLTEYPLSTPKHCIALTQREVMTAAAYCLLMSDVKDTSSAQEVLGKNVGGYPVTLEFAKKTQEFSELIISEWEEGNLLTKPTFLFGVDDIQPNPNVKYTKPILLLINYLDFSGGDFLPAIMKDNQRATILGTRTAGAGGYVIESSFFNLGGIKKFTLTGSCAKTKDQKHLENNGVNPDILVELSVNDLQNNCVDLKRAILQAVDSITTRKK